jgi:hypothetical protein
VFTIDPAASGVNVIDSKCIPCRSGDVFVTDIFYIFSVYKSYYGQGRVR